MKDSYYKQYYDLERNNWWFVARKEILRSQLKRIFGNRKNLKILNVGAAFGATTVMLQEFGEVCSVEYSKECCDFVNEKLNLNFVHGSITELPYKDNQFDLACAFDVVEHVDEDQLAVDELHRVCKSGGYIFTTVPAFKSLWSEHDDINEHKRRYTMKNFTRLFNNKSSIVFKSYFNSFLFLPVAAYRLVATAFKRKAKKKELRSDFNKIENSFATNILYKIFKSENRLLRKKIRFPIGLSIMVIAKKQ